MCVETLKTGFVFPRQLICRVTHLGLALKNEHLPIYLLRNPINVFWNSQNRACFSETIDLRGHISRFIWKMNVFLSLSLETPWMCVETLRTGLIILRHQFEGSHVEVSLKNEHFSHLSAWKLHKWVLELLEQGSFFQVNWFEWFICLCLL